jgi:hypothetical protein
MLGLKIFKAGVCGAIVLFERRFTHCEIDETAIVRKRQLGYKAVDDFVRSNMTVGLGSGTTTGTAATARCQLTSNSKLTIFFQILP